MDKDVALRIAIKRSIEKFIRQGTKIELMEDKPEIIYNSLQLSRCIESIMKAVKET